MTDTPTSEVDWKSPEAMAWSRCELEHGLDDLCVRCENLAYAFRRQREAGRREGAKALQADIGQGYQQAAAQQAGTVEAQVFRQVAREVANWDVDAVLAADDQEDKDD